ncbi:MAG: hypothetical protein AB7I38_09510 [Dehalococcoidia bacterium]
MAEVRSRRWTADVEYVALGTIGERELRGVVERRELRVGSLRIGRVRPRSVHVLGPSDGGRPVAVDPPPDPFLRALRWTLVVIAGAAAVRMLARGRHTR